jgi:Chaperone of endosialidase
MNFFLRLLPIVVLLSCVSREGTVTFGTVTESGLFPNPTINNITASGSQLIIKGNNFSGITGLSITNQGQTWEKTFQVISVTPTQLVAESLDQIPLPVNTQLNLKFVNAYGTNPYNVKFPLTDNSVQTPMIQNNAVTGPKFLTVSKSKLNKAPGTTPVDGYILKWAATPTNGFYLGYDEAIDAAAGLVAGITLGEGFKGEGTTITSAGILELDIDAQGSSSATKIPYFNSLGQLRLKDPAKIILENTSRISMGAENGVFKIKDNANTLAYVDAHGPWFDELFVGANQPCLSDGTNCPASLPQVTGIVTTPPLMGGGTVGTITISADWGTASGQLVRLGGTTTGILPAVNASNLLGVIHSIIPGTSMSAQTVGSEITLNALIGTGNAQGWKTYLNNLGSLNPNNNWVIIGNQDNFVVRGGVDLQTAIGLLPGKDIQAYSKALEDIATITYPPADEKFISGNGTIWATKDIPACGSNYAILGKGTTGFACSDDATPIYAGTYITTAQEAFKINPSGGSSSSVRFYANNNSNYTGFKAPNTPNTTLYTLPATDGTSGQILGTNGAGGLSFVTNYSGDSVGVAASTANYPPLFADNNGKQLSTQNVLIVSGNNVGINNSTPANLLYVATADNGDGIESGPAFLGTCRGLTNSCLTHTNYKASTTGYALSQDSTGNTLVNADTGQGIKFRINNVDAVTVTSAGKVGVGVTNPTKFLEVSGAGGENGAILGNAYIGQTATHGNTWAGFLYSGLGDNSYALLQNNAGITLLNAATDQYISFRINNSDKMRMTKDGELGIGTNAPGAKLTVNAGNIKLEDQTSPTAFLVSSTGDGANLGEILFLESTDNDGWRIRHNGLTDTNPPNNGTDDPLEYYRLTGGGNVLNFLMAEDGQLWARVTNIGDLSDQTLKKNIEDFSFRASSIINQFRPVNFYWDDPQFDAGEHIGFLAQEVEKIDTRFIQYNPVIKKLMVRYNEILPIMIANLRELNTKTKDLEGISLNNLAPDLAELKKKQQDLSLRLAKLKRNP